MNLHTSHKNRNSEFCGVDFFFQEPTGSWSGMNMQCNEGYVLVKSKRCTIMEMGRRYWGKPLLSPPTRIRLHYIEMMSVFH